MEFMPFGKYKGRPFNELPDSYLDWLMGTDTYEPLTSCLWTEKNRRVDLAKYHGSEPEEPVRRFQHGEHFDAPDEGRVVTEHRTTAKEQMDALIERMRRKFQ